MRRNYGEASATDRSYEVLIEAIWTSLLVYYAGNEIGYRMNRVLD